MSKAVSIKMRDDVFEEIERLVKRLKTTRNAYINDAVAFFNRVNRRARLKKRLALESAWVSSDSMKALAEFEALSDKAD